MTDVLLLVVGGFLLLGFCNALLVVMSREWSELRRRFPDRPALPLRTYRFVAPSVGDGWKLPISTIPTFAFALCEEGLRVRLMAPFNLAGSPVFVPWREVEVAQTPPLLGLTNVYLGEPMAACLAVRSSMARRICDFRRALPLSGRP